MRVECSYCGALSEKATGHFNRAAKGGYALYCDRTCAGLGRRRDKTVEQRKAEKAAYDAVYRAQQDQEARKAAKAAYYQATRDPVKEAAVRKLRMPLHVEYCRRPEYREKKSVYDQRRRDGMNFGEFAEVAEVLRIIEAEIDQRATRYEIYQQNGTINKALTRRRAL